MQYEYLYTISPLILSDCIPNKASVASIISDYFYLFKIYSENPYIVRLYMKFIDENFDFAFTELNYQMIQYKYPEIYKDDELQKLEFINSYYQLNDSMSLYTSYRANKFELPNQTIYFNSYAIGDSVILGDILLDEELSIIPQLMELLNYVRCKPEKDYLQTLLYQYSEYEGYLIDYLMNPDTYIESEYIEEPLVILYRLKSFVNHTKEKRLLK